MLTYIRVGKKKHRKLFNRQGGVLLFHLKGSFTKQSERKKLECQSYSNRMQPREYAKQTC